MHMTLVAKDVHDSFEHSSLRESTENHTLQSEIKIYLSENFVVTSKW